MTTIVYNHDKKEIAIDSRLTCNGIINSDAYDKTIKHEDSLYFLTGWCADHTPFVQGHNSGNTEKELDCYAYMVQQTHVYLVVLEKGVYKTMELTYNDAMGSGWKFALSALDLGKDTKQAVEYAATRDTATGGQIRIFSVVNHEWKL